MHLIKQDFSFKDAKDQKAKRLRETILVLSLELSYKIDPRLRYKGT